MKQEKDLKKSSFGISSLTRRKKDRDCLKEIELWILKMEGVNFEGVRCCNGKQKIYQNSREESEVHRSSDVTNIIEGKVLDMRGRDHGSISKISNIV